MAHLCVKDSLKVLQPLVCCIKAGLPVEFHCVVLQKVLQAPLLDCRLWLRTKGGCISPVLLQLAKGLHMLLVSILNDHPCNLHLLHHQLLLLKRCRLSLHRCLVLLHHGCALLSHGRYHRLYCPGDIGYVTRRELLSPTRRCHSSLAHRKSLG